MSGSDKGGGEPAGAEQLIANARRAFFVMFGLLAVVWLQGSDTR
ncbi:hypothetical protein ACFWDQ_04760 [Streptomyces sp. NPDC060053]